MGNFVTVAKTTDLQAGSGKAVTAGGKTIALFNVDGTYCAIDDSCSHRGGPLSEGDLNGSIVTCPWHAGRFDVTTGEVKSPPPPKSVIRYAVRIQGDEVQVEV